MVVMRNAAKRKNAAAVVVQVRVTGGVEVGAARRAASNAGAGVASGNVHGAENTSARDPAARIGADVIVDTKFPLWGRN